MDLLNTLYRFIPNLAQQPALVSASIVGALGLTSFGIWVARLPMVRIGVRRFFYILRNTMTPEARFHDFITWASASLGAGLTVAFLKLANKGTWKDFWLYLTLYVVGQAVAKILASATVGEVLSRPLLGRMWRGERKVLVGAIIKKVNLQLHLRTPLSATDARALITDLLEVVAMHVRDYRGNHDPKKVDVFASLLLVDGKELVVVARDATLNDHRDLKRDVPRRYPMSDLAAAQAITGGRVISVGDYYVEYPHFPKSKPYRSILAIPVISSDNKTVLGALSIDSSRPYFFDSFTPGNVANSLENNLSPHVHTLVLILEHLLPHERARMVRLLCEQSTVKGEAV